jgi:4-amino-4-deoxy-L-arabinose transferase-like glycosyltransferase
VIPPGLVRRRYRTLAVLGILLFAPFLGARTFWYPDEPDLAETTQAMAASGDWVLPTANGAPFVDYPPLLYWAGAASASLFRGMSEFSLRFPLAVAGILAALATALAGSRWFGPTAGLWSGVLLLTFHKFALQAVTYRPDALFTVAIAGGMLLYAWGAEGRGGLGRRAGGFALLGAAMLAKGPLGLLLPGLVLLLWHASRREFGRAAGLAPLSLVSLGVYLPWFVACARAMGAESILHEFWVQNFLRFFEGGRGHEQPFHYYATFFWVNLWPWSFLFPTALVWTWRSALRRDRNVQLLLWWFGTFLVFLSLASTQRHVYLLPAYPAAALLMAPWLARWTDPPPAGEARYGGRALDAWAMAMAAVSWTVGIVLLVIAAGGPSLIERIRPDPKALEVAPLLRVPALVLGLVLLISAAVLGRAWRRRDRAASLAAAAGTYWLVFAICQGLLMPAFEPLKTFRPQSRWLLSRLPPGTPAGMVDLGGYSSRRRAAFAYYMERPMPLLETAAEVDGFFRRFPGSLVLVEAEAWKRVAPADGSWDARLVRELAASDEEYRVLRGPDGF